VNYLGEEHLNNKNEIKTGLAPVLDFPGVDIEQLVILVQLFCQLVRESAFPHEPADMLDRGHAVQSIDRQPAVRRNFDHGCGVAYQLDGIVVKDTDIGLGVLMAIVGFRGVIHVQILLSFISCPLGQLYINI